MAKRRPTAPDLAALLPSWELSLRAERKSPQTVKGYGDGVRRFLAYCEREGVEPVSTGRPQRGSSRTFSTRAPSQRPPERAS